MSTMPVSSVFGHAGWARPVWRSCEGMGPLPLYMCCYLLHIHVHGNQATFLSHSCIHDSPSHMHWIFLLYTIMPNQYNHLVSCNAVILLLASAKIDWIFFFRLNCNISVLINAHCMNRQQWQRDYDENDEKFYRPVVQVLGKSERSI